MKETFPATVDVHVHKDVRQICKWGSTMMSIQILGPITNAELLSVVGLGRGRIFGRHVHFRDNILLRSDYGDMQH